MLFFDFGSKKHAHFFIFVQLTSLLLNNPFLYALPAKLIF